jgi:hypothetical protein
MFILRSSGFDGLRCVKNQFNEHCVLWKVYQRVTFRNTTIGGNAAVYTRRTPDCHILLDLRPHRYVVYTDTNFR